MDVSKLSVDVLAANLDKLPALMAKLSVSPTKTSKFAVLGPNHSFAMDDLLRPSNQNYGDRDISYELSRNKRMKDQARKVLKHLNDLTTSVEGAHSTTSHDLGDIASIAAKTIKNMSKSRNENINFANFDVNRRSNISYETFSKVLSIGNSGLSPNQKYALAAKIDGNQSGVLDYNNIMDAIVNVESEHKSNTGRDNSAAAATTATISSSSTGATASAKLQEEYISPPVEEAKQNSNFDSNNDINGDRKNVDIVITLIENPPSAGHAAPPTTKNQTNYHNENSNQHLNDHVQFILSPDNPNKSFCSRNIKEIFNSKEGEPQHRSVRRMFHNSYMRNQNGVFPYYRDNDVSYFVRKSPGDTFSSEKVKRPSSAPPRNNRYSSAGESSDASSLDSHTDELLPLDNFHSYVFSNQSPKSKFISHQDIDTTVGAVKDAIAENTVASQINGNINGLRHQLRKVDISGSGTVNFDEFKAVLNKLEIEVPKQNLEKYFRQHCEPSLGQDQMSKPLLSIENFVSDMTNISCESPNLKRSKESLLENDTRRVFKHLSHTMNKTSDPLLVFKHLNEHNRGFLTANQLKEGFTLNGTAMSDREFSLLVNKLNVNNDGLIAMSDVDQLLHKTCNVYDVGEKIKLASKYQENRRYSKSFQSNVTALALHTNQAEYNSLMAMSKIHRQESMLWHKLKVSLRDKHEEFTKLFTSNGETNLDNIKPEHLTEKIDFKELTNRMDNAGIKLGNGDKTILEIQLKRHANDDTFDLNTFCGLLEGSVVEDCRANGFRADHKLRPTHVSVLHPQSQIMEGGVFAYATRSGSRTFATTMLEDDTEADLFEHRKRRHHKSLAEYCLEPSKFWEMPHGYEIDPLLPHPLPNFRSTAQFSNRDEGTRITLNSSICKNALQPTPRSQLRQMTKPKCMMNDIIFGSSTANVSSAVLYSSSNSILVEGGGKKRPLSAPPRSGLKDSGRRLNLFPDALNKPFSSSNFTSIDANNAQLSIASTSNAFNVPVSVVTSQSIDFASGPSRTLRKRQVKPIGEVVSGAPFALGH